MLGMGRGSRLYQRLVYRDQTATSVSGGSYPFEIASPFMLDVMVKPGGDTQVAIVRHLSFGKSRQMRISRSAPRVRMLRGMRVLIGAALAMAAATESAGCSRCAIHLRS